MNKAYRALYEKFVEANQINFYKFVYARNMTYLLYRFIDSSRLEYDDKLEISSPTTSKILVKKLNFFPNFFIFTFLYFIAL